MTIQDLADLYESHTGIKMTRQNLSQRLRRDNFPEQDMHELAGMLGYQVSVHLTPMAEAFTLPVRPAVLSQQTKVPASQKVITADGSTIQVPNLLHKEPVLGDINPLTGQEYLTNTVRQHPVLDKHLQVYDRSGHEWVDVGEDDFWEFQASKKEIMGSDYQEPIII